MNAYKKAECMFTIFSLITTQWDKLNIISAVILNSVDWNEVYEANEVDSDSHYNNHVPLNIKTTGKSHKSTVDPHSQSIVNSCLFKNRLHRRYLRNPTVASERCYKTYRYRWLSQGQLEKYVAWN